MADEPEDVGTGEILEPEEVDVGAAGLGGGESPPEGDALGADAEDAAAGDADEGTLEAATGAEGTGVEDSPIPAKFRGKKLDDVLTALENLTSEEERIRAAIAEYQARERGLGEERNTLGELRRTVPADAEQAAPPDPVLEQAVESAKKDFTRWEKQKVIDMRLQGYSDDEIPEQLERVRGEMWRTLLEDAYEDARGRETERRQAMAREAPTMLAQAGTAALQKGGLDERFGLTVEDIEGVIFSDPRMRDAFAMQSPEAQAAQAEAAAIYALGLKVAAGEVDSTSPRLRGASGAAGQTRAPGVLRGSTRAAPANFENDREYQAILQQQIRLNSARYDDGDPEDVARVKAQAERIYRNLRGARSGGR